jgi:hypothetical protein
MSFKLSFSKCLSATTVHFNETEHQKKDNFRTSCSGKANILPDLVHGWMAVFFITHLTVVL